MYCPQCGAISTDASCGNCGAQLPDMQASPSRATSASEKRKASPLLIGALILVLVALVDTLIKSSADMRAAMFAYLGGAVARTLLWLVLLTSFSMCWISVKNGGRRAIFATLMALPIILVVGYILLG